MATVHVEGDPIQDRTIAGRSRLLRDKPDRSGAELLRDTPVNVNISTQHSGLRTPLITHHSSLITRLRDLAACLLLAALSVVFAWPVAGLGQLPNSGDFILQYYPNLAFLARNLREGILPLWNPTLFAGTPYLADPQSQLLYFPNWPFLVLLDLNAAARAIVVAHLALAAVTSYSYMRHLRLGVLPALLGAVVYGFGPYAIGKVAWLPMLISMAWMPLALLFFEQALTRRSLARASLAGATLAIQFFNGWPHGSYITAFALLALFLWHLAAPIAQKAIRLVGRGTLPYGANELARLCAVAAATGVVFLGFVAPVLFPFLEFWRQSNYVAERGVEAAASEGSVTILALFGVGGSEGHGVYLGMIGWALALIGVLHGVDRRRWLYLMLAGFGLLVALGANAPVYGFLYGWVPGFKTFHMPGRFAVLFVFSVSVLAATGADTLSRKSGRILAISTVLAAAVLSLPGFYALSRMLGPDSPAWLAGNLLNPDAGPYLNAPIAAHVAVAGLVALAFLVVLATNRVPRSAAAALALILVAGDLFLFQGKDASYFSQLPLALREPSPMPAIAQLSGERDFRIAGFEQNGVSHFLSDFPFNLNPALLPPNFALVYGAEDVQGYLPLRLRAYAEYVAAINGGDDDYHWALVRNFQSPLLDMLGVRYVTARDNDARLRNITLATNLDVRSSQTTTIRPDPILATSLQVHSYLGGAQNLENGRVVARVKVTDNSGEAQSFDMRAGIETAEWGYDRLIAGEIKHNRAPISQTRNLPSSTHTYLGSFTFPRPWNIAEISIEQVEPSVHLSVAEIVAVPANPVDRYEKIGELNGGNLYRNRLALPRVLMVPRAEVVATPEAALARIQRPDFDPRQTVVLEGQGAPSTEPAGKPMTGEVAVDSRGPNGLRLTVNAASSGFLLLNELSYPGWNAYLDGRQVAAWRANYLFRAIEVPPGKHDVEFRFEPDSMKLGLALSASTLALLLAATAALRLKSRQQKENTRP